MLASEVADQCVRESGARGKHAKNVALIGLLVVPNGALSMREYRARMKQTFLRTHPECGSFFLIFVLPILISLISNWIAKWIINRTDMEDIRSQAFDELTESLPHMVVRRMSISGPPEEPTRPSP